MGLLRLLIVRTNPSPWAASVQAPFARPGNRFWKSLYAAGVTETLVNDSTGMQRSDELMLARRGVGITNIVSRPTSRSVSSAAKSWRRMRPAGSGCGCCAHRWLLLRGSLRFVVLLMRRKLLGFQPTHNLPGWPTSSQLWVVPDPSGLMPTSPSESLGKMKPKSGRSALKQNRNASMFLSEIPLRSVAVGVAAWPRVDVPRWSRALFGFGCVAFLVRAIASAKSSTAICFESRWCDRYVARPPSAPRPVR